MRRSGLGSELSTQVARGSDALSSGVPHGSGVSLPTPAGVGAGLGAWVTNDALDGATVAALVGDGYSELVVPAGSVASSPTTGSTTQPFSLSDGQRIDLG